MAPIGPVCLLANLSQLQSSNFISTDGVSSYGNIYISVLDLKPLLGSFRVSVPNRKEQLVLV